MVENFLNSSCKLEKRVLAEDIKIRRSGRIIGLSEIIDYAIKCAVGEIRKANYSDVLSKCPPEFAHLVLEMLENEREPENKLALSKKEKFYRIFSSVEDGIRNALSVWIVKTSVDVEINFK